MAFSGDEQINVHVTIDTEEKTFSSRTTTPLAAVDWVEKQIIDFKQKNALSFNNDIIAKLVGSNPTAKCDAESPVIAAPPGRELPCVVTNEQGETHEVLVTFTESGQLLSNWEFGADNALVQDMMRDVDPEQLAQEMMREMGIRDPEALLEIMSADDNTPYRDDSNAAISMDEVDAFLKENAKKNGLTAEQLQAFEPMKPKIHALLNALQQQANAQ